MRTRTLTPIVGSLLAEGIGALEGAGLCTARQDAEWLLADVLGLERFRLYLDPDGEVPAKAAEAFRSRIGRRAAGEPLQHVLGFEEFRGLPIRTTPAALIPRPETELLVDWALALERTEGPWRVAVDVGTGTGAIACALAVALPGLRVLAVDRSLGALALAAQNVRALGLQGQVSLLAGDLLEPLAGLVSAVDLVISNPPYIPTAGLSSLPVEVREWEPRQALDGGADGMAVHRRLVAPAAGVLRLAGWLLMEMGEGQAEPLRRWMEASGFGRVEVRRDLRGVERMIGGRVPGTHAESVGAEAWVR